MGFYAKIKILEKIQENYHILIEWKLITVAIMLWKNQ